MQLHLMLGCTVHTIVAASPPVPSALRSFALEGEPLQVHDGMQAEQLAPACWRKSHVSNPSGSCVEVAELPGDAIALRNSRHPSGPVLIYARAEVAAFLAGVKNGEFDDLCPGSVLSLPEVIANGVRRVP